MMMEHLKGQAPSEGSGEGSLIAFSQPRVIASMPWQS